MARIGNVPIQSDHDLGREWRGLPLMMSGKAAAEFLGESRWTFRETAAREGFRWKYRGGGRNRKAYYVPDLIAYVRRSLISTPEDAARAVDARRRENRAWALRNGDHHA